MIQELFFCGLAHVHLNMFIHSITPVPLRTGNFHGQCRLTYQVIISVHKRLGRQCNQCYNYRGQNCPNLFQRCVVIKTLRNWLQTVMETNNNSSSQPQYQNQNNNQEKANICVKVYNSLHIRGCRVLKQFLPRHRCISTNITHIPYHRDHFIINMLFFIYFFYKICTYIFLYTYINFFIVFSIIIKK